MRSLAVRVVQWFGCCYHEIPVQHDASPQHGCRATAVAIALVPFADVPMHQIWVLISSIQGAESSLVLLGFWVVLIASPNL